MTNCIYPIQNHDGAHIGAVYQVGSRFEGVRRWRNEDGWPASNSAGVYADRDAATTAVRKMHVPLT